MALDKRQRDLGYLKDKLGNEYPNPRRIVDTVYTPKEILNKSAEKKNIIVEDILDEEDQLNLLAALIEEYLESVNYNTPLFLYAKGEFAKIKAVLNE